MGFNLTSGLMAGSNFGTGFQQGQANAMQLQLQRMAMQQAQLQQQQQQQKMAQQQALSDFAMSTFNPTITNPATGQPIGGAAPGNNGANNADPSAGAAPPPDASMDQPPVDPMDQTISQMDALANKAASLGDLDHYTQLTTNAANLRINQSNVEEHQSAAKLAEARRQMINYQQIAGMFSGIDPNSPTFEKDFRDQQLAAESLPTTSPEEAKNISSWKPTPLLLKNIVQGGMSAAQRASAQHQELVQGETERMDSFRMDMDKRRLALAKQTEQAREQDKLRGNKVGKVVPSPTETDLATAANIVGPLVFPSGKVNEDDPSYKQAVTTLASRAKAYQQQHQSVPYTTALATVAQQAQQIGEFTPTQTEENRKFLGIDIPGTSQEVAGPTKFQTKGDNSSAALPLPANPKSPKSYIPNKYYNVPGHGPMMWVVKPDGTSGFDPNS